MAKKKRQFKLIKKYPAVSWRLKIGDIVTKDDLLGTGGYFIPHETSEHLQHKVAEAIEVEGWEEFWEEVK